MITFGLNGSIRAGAYASILLDSVHFSSMKTEIKFIPIRNNGAPPVSAANRALLDSGEEGMWDVDFIDHVLLQSNFSTFTKKKIFMFVYLAGRADWRSKNFF